MPGLVRDLNFGDRTQNEEIVQENIHSYLPFIMYCESKEVGKRKQYFSEHFDLEEAFGPNSGCEECSGTGWVPVSNSYMSNPYRSLWVQAELDSPADDGFHLVPCCKCSPIQTGLSEHIVKVGDSFELKSKSGNKNLGTYKSKAGAKKREGQVEYFKHLHEKSEAMSQWSPDKTPDTRPLPWRLHEDEILPGNPSKKDSVTEDILPSEHNKKQSQDKKDKKKASETKSDPNESPEDKKEKSKEKRAEKERDRKAKKLLPYEFTDQKDAERAGGHLGIHGSHASGNGIYKPGSSDYSLRDAVARKKAKQKMRGKFHEETDSTIPYPMDKGNCHESSTLQKIKECVNWNRNENAG